MYLAINNILFELKRQLLSIELRKILSFTFILFFISEIVNKIANKLTNSIFLI